MQVFQHLRYSGLMNESEWPQIVAESMKNVSRKLEES